MGMMRRNQNLLSLKLQNQILKEKKAGRKSKDQNLEQKEGNGSDKENETKVDQIETIEKEPINGKHPKPKRSKTSEPQVKRRTLRSSICDSKKTEEDKSSDAEIKKESEVKEETEKETEPLESKPNKRK